MAKKGDIEQPLTLEFSADAVAPADFVRAVSAFVNLVEGLDPEGQPVVWGVEVKNGSNLVGLRPIEAKGHIGDVAGAVAAIAAGIELLSQRSKEPNWFTDKAVRALRDLARLGKKQPIQVWANFERHTLGEIVERNASELIDGAYVEDGSVEGRLQTVSEHGGFRFVIYEPVWDRAIRCRVSDEMQAEVMESFGKRVEVYGPVRYRKDGVAVSVSVDSLVSFPDSNRLPGPKEVEGILRNFKRG